MGRFLGPDLVDLVVAVLEEVPEEREDLFRALFVHVPHSSHTLYDGLLERETRDLIKVSVLNQRSMGTVNPPLEVYIIGLAIHMDLW